MAEDKLANSFKLKVSALLLGSIPILFKITLISLLGKSKFAAKEFATIFLLCPKAERTTQKNNFSSGT